jgi:transposase-like protein
MSTDRIRDAVAMYLNESLTEAEAARRAGLSRAQFRQYVRTCGLALQATDAEADATDADTDCTETTALEG